MSVTARLNRLKDVASDVTRTTIRVASPLVSATAARVRSRWQREPQSASATAPSGSAHRTSGSVQEAATPPARTRSARGSGPNPASVARNIAPHPPRPVSAPARTAPRSAPGAKLPPRRRSADEGRD